MYASRKHLAASNSKYVVCFKKLFAGKGGLYEFIMVYNMRAELDSFYGNSKAFSCQNEVSVFLLC